MQTVFFHVLLRCKTESIIYSVFWSVAICNCSRIHFPLVARNGKFFARLHSNRVPSS